MIRCVCSLSRAWSLPVLPSARLRYPPLPPKYYFINALFAVGMVFGLVGLTIWLRWEYNVFSDPVGPLIFLVMFLFGDLVQMLLLRIGDIKVRVAHRLLVTSRSSQAHCACSTAKWLVGRERIPWVWWTQPCEGVATGGTGVMSPNRRRSSMTVSALLDVCSKGRGIVCFTSKCQSKISR